MPNGDLVAAGWFTSAGGNPANRVAQHAPGCPSSGGANSLSAAALPWLGSTFTTSASGLPMTALAAQLTGFEPAAPIALTSLSPLGVSGCDLHVTPELAQFIQATSGGASFPLPIPNTPDAIGVTLFQQVVVLELSPSGSPVELTGTNALLSIIGDF
jgi:hypothetical protein